MIIHKKIDRNQTPEQREEFLHRLSLTTNQGYILLKTCNRVEYYSGNGPVPETVIRHLFRLTSGLESLFIGETFIQGQVKEAYQQACNQGPLNASLHRLFQWALLTGKRVRSETAISRGAMSHSQAVVEIIRNNIPNYNSKQFAFIGINKMNLSIMNFLQSNVNTSFVLCNRTYDKALELEGKFNCRALRLDHLKDSLAESDIIISATSAPHAIIHPEDVPSHKKLAIFDLAVPRDADPQIERMPNIRYFGIQDIENNVSRNISGRTGEIIQASAIVEEEVIRFLNYQEKYSKMKRQMPERSIRESKLPWKNIGEVSSESPVQEKLQYQLINELS